MLSACTRPQTLRLLQAQRSAAPISLRSALTALSGPSRLQLVRTARTKVRRNETYFERMNREDEKLLRKLEAQMERAKVRVAKEDAEAARLSKQQADNMGGEEFGMDLETAHRFFWDKVLTKQDRADLGFHNIYTLKDLTKSYGEAMTLLATNPEISVASLNPRLRYAHEVYESIPDRVASAKQLPPKPKSVFGNSKFF